MCDLETCMGNAVLQRSQEQVGLLLKDKATNLLCAFWEVNSLGWFKYNISLNWKTKAGRIIKKVLPPFEWAVLEKLYTQKQLPFLMMCYHKEMQVLYAVFKIYRELQSLFIPLCPIKPYNLDPLFCSYWTLFWAMYFFQYIEMIEI